MHLPPNPRTTGGAGLADGVGDGLGLAAVVAVSVAVKSVFELI